MILARSEEEKMDRLDQNQPKDMKGKAIVKDGVAHHPDSDHARGRVFRVMSRHVALARGYAACVAERCRFTDN